jgi:copper chaperone CopZ
MGAMSETVTYTVAGMTCGHCAAAVTAELSKLPGVVDVVVALDGGRVTVRADRPLAAETVRSAIDEAGYELADP